MPESYVGIIQPGEVAEVEMYLQKLERNQILLITGSIYLLGEIMEAVKNNKNSYGSSFQDLV
jgi:uncharacterized protein with ACT and thioredoxin-like domain